MDVDAEFPGERPEAGERRIALPRPRCWRAAARGRGRGGSSFPASAHSRRPPPRPRGSGAPPRRVFASTESPLRIWIAAARKPAMLVSPSQVDPEYRSAAVADNPGEDQDVDAGGARRATAPGSPPSPSRRSCRRRRPAAPAARRSIAFCSAGTRKAPRTLRSRSLADRPTCCAVGADPLQRHRREGLAGDAPRRSPASAADWLKRREPQPPAVERHRHDDVGLGGAARPRPAPSTPPIQRASSVRSRYFSPCTSLRATASKRGDRAQPVEGRRIGDRLRRQGPRPEIVGEGNAEPGAIRLLDQPEFAPADRAQPAEPRDMALAGEALGRQRQIGRGGRDSAQRPRPRPPRPLPRVRPRMNVPVHADQTSAGTGAAPWPFFAADGFSAIAFDGRSARPITVRMDRPAAHLRPRPARPAPAPRASRRRSGRRFSAARRRRRSDRPAGDGETALRPRRRYRQAAAAPRRPADRSRPGRAGRPPRPPRRARARIAPVRLSSATRRCCPSGPASLDLVVSALASAFRQRPARRPRPDPPGAEARRAVPRRPARRRHAGRAARGVRRRRGRTDRRRLAAGRAFRRAAAARRPAPARRLRPAGDRSGPADRALRHHVRSDARPARHGRDKRAGRALPPAARPGGR